MDCRFICNVVFIVTCTDKICKQKERKKEGRNSQLLLCAIYTFLRNLLLVLGKKGQNHSTLAYFNMCLLIYLFIYLF